MKVQRKGVAEGFSRAAGTYDSHATAQGAIASQLAQMLPAGEGMGWVIDLGCGTGFLTERLRGCYPGARVVCLDVAPGMVAAAREKLGDAGVDFVVADYTDPCCAAGLDLVASSCALQWGTDGRGTLGKWYRLLRPGGWMALALLVKGSFQELEDASVAVSGVPFSRLTFPSSRECEEWVCSLPLELVQHCSSEICVRFDRPLDALRSFRGLGATFRDQSDYRARSTGELRRLLDMYGRSCGEGAVLTYRALLVVGRKPIVASKRA